MVSYVALSLSSIVFRRLIIVDGWLLIACCCCCCCRADRWLAVRISFQTRALLCAFVCAQTVKSFETSESNVWRRQQQQQLSRTNSFFFFFFFHFIFFFACKLANENKTHSNVGERSFAYCRAGGKCKRSLTLADGKITWMCVCECVFMCVCLIPLLVLLLPAPLPIQLALAFWSLLAFSVAHNCFLTLQIAPARAHLKEPILPQQTPLGPHAAHSRVSDWASKYTNSFSTFTIISFPACSL